LPRPCAGLVELAEQLLQHQPDIDVANAEGSTPLHWAARRDQHVIVHLLLQAGASVKMQNKWGFTPLEVAQQNQCELASAMISQWIKNSAAPKTPPSKSPPKLAPQVRALPQEERQRREQRKRNELVRRRSVQGKLKEEEAGRGQVAAARRAQEQTDKQLARALRWVSRARTRRHFKRLSSRLSKQAWLPPT